MSNLKCLFSKSCNCMTISLHYLLRFCFKYFSSEYCLKILQMCNFKFLFSKSCNYMAISDTESIISIFWYWLLLRIHLANVTSSICSNTDSNSWVYSAWEHSCYSLLQHSKLCREHIFSLTNSTGSTLILAANSG